MLEKVKASDKFIILNNSRIMEILGEKFLTGIKIKKEERKEVLSVQGVFVEIGLIPNSEFAEDLKKNDTGEIKVDCLATTSIPGIFATGDVTDVPEKQIIIAAGERAKAALSTFRYLM